MALLQELFGGGNQQGGGGGLPMQMAVLGALTYRTVKGQGSLADMIDFDGGTPQTTQSSIGVQSDTGCGMFSGLPGMFSGGLGGLTGMLSQVSGGNAGKTVSDGVQHLLDRFRQNGLGEKVASWISKNPNKPISPCEMAQGLGSDMVSWLMNETGMPKDQLLFGLSRYLPEAVDKLTPKGKVPTPQDAQQHVDQQQTH